MVAIIFRAESKGISPVLGHKSRTSSGITPAVSSMRSRAASMGSPSPPLPKREALLLRAAPQRNSCTSLRSAIFLKASGPISLWLI